MARPVIICSGAGDEKLAANAWNQAFMVTVIVNTTNKKILEPIKHFRKLRSIEMLNLTYKNVDTVCSNFTKKYSTIANTAMVVAVIRISTSVRASDSAKGWYIAALDWRRMIGLWENNARISAIVDIAANRRALKNMVKTGLNW